MVYTPTNWKNREVEKPRTFQIQNNADGTVTLIPKEGNVIEPGTPIIADTMNNLEQGVKQAHDLTDGIGNLENTVTSHLADGAAHGIGNKATLQTSHKNTLVGAINEVFQAGNNVKRDMVDVLLSVDPSLPITYDSTWSQIESAASQISTGKKFATGVTASSGSILTVRGLSFEPKLIFTKHPDVEMLYYTSLHIDKGLLGLTNDLSVRIDQSAGHFDSNWTKYTDGFNVRVSGTQTLKWLAYE